MNSRGFLFAAALLTAGAAAACSSGNAGAPSNAAPQMPPRLVQPQLAFGSAPFLTRLAHEETIGSTVPETPGDVNPYGLTIAMVTLGKIAAGDLIVCDFNNPGNVQGTGTEIVALHPIAGATPRLIAKNHTLMGCNALAAAPSGDIWAAAFKANDTAVFNASGTLLTDLPEGPWNHPFGITFAPPRAPGGPDTFYVSNAADGSIVRVQAFLGPAPIPAVTFSVIATGFPVNGGKPGSILAPSGLNYQREGDRLYIVDGTNNALYAIDRVSDVPAHGIAVNGLTFSGPSAGSAHVIYSGTPLNGPISSAILPGGNVVLGNTLDPDGQNLMVEIKPTGQLAAVKNVDTGPAGAIFGMVATGTNFATTRLYFNDDNDNTVKVLTP